MNYNKYISSAFIHLIFLLDHPTKVFEDNHETTRDKRTIQVRSTLFYKFNKFTFCFSPHFFGGNSSKLNFLLQIYHLLIYWWGRN